jgi:8-amino-7-oxononanoate synthase
MIPDPRGLDEALAGIERQHLARARRTVEAFAKPDGAAEVLVEGRRLVNFCSNDYLGLARHPRVAAALREGAAAWGAGSGASHLVTGHGLEHARLEEELASFVRRERALLVSTGYMANLAVITTLAGRGDRVLLDRLSHASLIDAALLSGARLRRFAHRDADAARRMVCAGADGRSPYAASGRARVIATDGLFSMDGDLAPVAALAELASASRTWLVVDDAHGLGVLGAGGRGTLEHLGGLSAEAVPVLVGTLGKAFGTFGAFVAGSRALIELMVQRARSYIYTTALPQALAAATRAALRVSQEESWRRERVLALAARFRAAAREQGIPLMGCETPIQPVPIGTAEGALRASRALFEAGFWVTAIRPPTVPRGTARLRISFSAEHSETQVDALVESLARSLRALGTPTCRPEAGAS